MAKKMYTLGIYIYTGRFHALETRAGSALRCFSYNGLRRCELSSENRKLIWLRPRSAARHRRVACARVCARALFVCVRVFRACAVCACCVWLYVCVCVRARELRRTARHSERRRRRRAYGTDYTHTCARNTEHMSERTGTDGTETTTYERFSLYV